MHQAVRPALKAGTLNQEVGLRVSMPHPHRGLVRLHRSQGMLPSPQEESDLKLRSADLAPIESMRPRQLNRFGEHGIASGLNVRYRGDDFNIRLDSNAFELRPVREVHALGA